ncbi:hypothetical protein K456DRAFT_1621046 [Colletotrichum gloeosporioides 23]|nr:hypothetical protein K456DRAFT_1621046 [Colletotrichum gloeosporioides 23]
MLSRFSTSWTKQTSVRRVRLVEEEPNINMREGSDKAKPLCPPILRSTSRYPSQMNASSSPRAPTYGDKCVDSNVKTSDQWGWLSANYITAVLGPLKPLAWTFSGSVRPLHRRSTLTARWRNFLMMVHTIETPSSHMLFPV